MNCTGERCIVQYGKVDPATCQCVSYCLQATPPKTNADRIRAMSDEELAEYLFKRGNYQEYCYGICDIQDECDDWPSDEDCIRHIVKWMKKEVKE